MADRSSTNVKQKCIENLRSVAADFSEYLVCGHTCVDLATWKEGIVTCIEGQQVTLRNPITNESFTTTNREELLLAIRLAHELDNSGVHQELIDSGMPPDLLKRHYHPKKKDVPLSGREARAVEVPKLLLPDFITVAEVTDIAGLKRFIKSNLSSLVPSLGGAGGRSYFSVEIADGKRFSFEENWQPREERSIIGAVTENGKEFKYGVTPHAGICSIGNIKINPRANIDEQHYRLLARILKVINILKTRSSDLPVVEWYKLQSFD